MGNQKSKSESKTQDGNNAINIEEHIDNNMVFQEAHELKLWIILILNISIVLYIVRKELQKRWRRQGFERARAFSQNNLDSPV